MKYPTHSQHADRGAVTLELVLALPVLLMLIIGSVVLGNFLSIKTQTVGAARDGARAAALGPEVWVDFTQDPKSDGFTFAITSNPCPNPTNPEAFVEVAATKTVSLRSIPFIPIDLLPGTITETVTMRCGG